jgi:hypothetical protein
MWDTTNLDGSFSSSKRPALDYPQQAAEKLNSLKGTAFRPFIKGQSEPALAAEGYEARRKGALRG